MTKPKFKVVRVGALVQATLVHVGGEKTQAFGVTEELVRKELQEKLVKRLKSKTEK